MWNPCTRQSPTSGFVGVGTLFEPLLSINGPTKLILVGYVGVYVVFFQFMGANYQQLTWTSMGAP